MTNAPKSLADHTLCADGTRQATTPAAATILVVLGICALTLSAKIQIPFYPVPMTLQTLAVLMIGALYGWRLGSLTVGSYLALGAAGLPVFAGPLGGLAYMAGPTGGFLFGFLLAALAAGYLTNNGERTSLLRLLFAMSVAHIVIFIAGLAYLSTLLPMQQAWEVGVAPFVLATLVKTGLAVGIVFALSTRKH